MIQFKAKSSDSPIGASVIGKTSPSTSSFHEGDGRTGVSVASHGIPSEVVSQDADGEEEEVGDSAACETARTPPLPRQLWWSALALLTAAALHSTMSLSAKIASKSFPTAQIMWSRYAIQLLTTSCVLIWRGRLPFGPSGVRHLLVARGIIGMISQGCHILSVSLLNLADAVSIHTIYPVLTALLAPRLLGEPLTCAAICAALAASAGCVLIVRGQHGTSHVDSEGRSDLGVGVALLGAFFASLTYMLIRRIMRSTSVLVEPEVVVWVYSATSVVCLFAALPFTLHRFVFDAPMETWGALVLVGMVSVVEQTLVTIGFKGLPAGAGTLLLTLETGFAFLFSIVYLHDSLKLTSVLGAILIASGIGMTAMQQLSKTEGRHVAHDKGDVECARLTPVVK